MRSVLVLLLLTTGPVYAGDILMQPANDIDTQVSEQPSSSGPLKRWNNGFAPVVATVSGPTRRWVNGRVLSTASIAVEDDLSGQSGPLRRWNNGTGGFEDSGGPARRWNNGG